MIAPQLIDEVKRLLAEGKLSQRRIAKATGVSRGTVGAIAVGKRPDYVALRRARADDLPQPVGPPRRCPSCGSTVLMPCMACHIRAKTKASRKFELRVRNGGDEDLALDLRPHHRARYEAVRDARAAMEAADALAAFDADELLACH